MSTVVGVFGPTGSGKTEVAVELARQLGTEIVNADPAQCYVGLPILTNQPTAEHDAAALHRLIGCWSLRHQATVAEFADRAHAEIDALVAANGHAVVCSGSGMYLRSALSAMTFGVDAPGDQLPGSAQSSSTDALAASALASDGGTSPRADEQLRAELLAIYNEQGGGVLHAELATLDADVAAAIHPNDQKRLIRALEVARRGGSVAAGAGSVWDAPYRHATTIIGLVTERAVVHTRINARTRAMFDGGVLDEVAAAVGEGPGCARLGELSATAVRIHGLRDCTELLKGHTSREVAIMQLATRTRQYARRQDTWARRWPQLWPVYIDLAAPDFAVTAREVATLVVGRAHEHTIAPQEVAR